MSYLVAFWNLENLFAPEGYPGREPWLAKALRRELAGWTEALFRRKIDQLAAIIRQMKAGAGPDILGVCEVENAFALQALADALNRALPARRYELVHVDSTRDQRGIDTAFLFDANGVSANRNELFSPARQGLGAHRRRLDGDEPRPRHAEAEARLRLRPGVHRSRRADRGLRGRQREPGARHRVPRRRH